MRQVETGMAERDMFIAQGSEDFTIHSMSGRLWEGVKCDLWGQTGKVNNNWESGRRGLTKGCRQREARKGWS